MPRSKIQAILEADYLLTVADAALVLRVSRSTVHRIIRRGELPVIRFQQRVVRILPTDLRVLLAEREKAAAETRSAKLKRRKNENRES